MLSLQPIRVVTLEEDRGYVALFREYLGPQFSGIEALTLPRDPYLGIRFDGIVIVLGGNSGLPDRSFLPRIISNNQRYGVTVWWSEASQEVAYFLQFARGRKYAAFPSGEYGFRLLSEFVRDAVESPHSLSIRTTASPFSSEGTPRLPADPEYGFWHPGRLSDMIHVRFQDSPYPILPVGEQGLDFLDAWTVARHFASRPETPAESVGIMCGDWNLRVA